MLNCSELMKAFSKRSVLSGFLREICVPETQRLKRRGKTLTLIAVFYTLIQSKILSSKEHS